MPNWVQIDLAKTERINRIVWSRDHLEKNHSLGVWDGTPIEYRFEVAVEPGQWHLVASSHDHPPFPLAYEYRIGADYAGAIKAPYIKPLVNPLVELAATNALRNPSEYRVDHWGEENETLQSTIGSIVQTPEGYLWIGTDQGLVRFDGDQFKTFNRDNTPALNPSAIDALQLDPKGQLLILLRGPPNNVVLYDHGQFKRPDLAGNWVRGFFTDRGGLFWGFTDQGFFPWKGDRFDLEAGTTNLHARTPYSLIVDQDTNVWMSVNSQVGKFVQRQFVPLLGQDGRPLAFGTANTPPILAPRPDGLIWILEGGGLGETARAPTQWRLLKPDGTVTEPKPFPWPQPGVEFRSVRCDGTGALWICSRKHGLFILSADGAHYQLYTEAEGLARREVQVSYEDREGNIWVGGWRGGLDRLRKPPFQTIAAAAGIGSENIYSLAPAREGGVWIGTHSRGVFLWRQGKTYLHEGAGGHSWAVLEDHAGSLWDGIYDGDLRRLTLTNMERFHCGPTRAWSLRELARFQGKSAGESSGEFKIAGNWL